MADMSSIERHKLERLLRMASGYELDSSGPTFSEFFEERTRRDVDAAVWGMRQRRDAVPKGANIGAVRSSVYLLQLPSRRVAT